MHDDRELLQKCLQHDQASWRALVRRYERLVYSIPLREGLSPEQAADVTQETFAKLFREAGAIRQPERLAGWLMTVARRETWRVGKAMKPTLDLTEDRDQLHVDDDFVEQHNEAAAIYEAVQSLGEPCRSLIFALFFDPAEPAYGAIAESIGRPLGSIGPLRGRCLGRLRAVLEAQVDGERSHV